MKRSAITLLALAITLSAFAGEPVKRGAAISADSKALTLASVLEKPEAYTKDAVIVEGVIEKNCERKGCWMQLSPKAGADGVRVTFKDYGFFVPLDAKGMKARAEGVTVIKAISKAEADHLEEEGAKLSRNEDGTAREVSFVATGVELWK